MIERFEELVTVFGGDGFIGRYVCEFLMQSGVRVRVASRDPRNSYFIQPLSQVGQLGVVKADVRNPASVKRALEAASAVINLTGVFGRQMWGVHVEGAGNVAKAAREEGCAALVHISAIGADPESASNYGRTKAEGEAAVRKAFPKSTIVRPSLVFGPEDQLTNRFAAMAELPFLPVIAAKRAFQPVYVHDLARAIAKAALEPRKHGGKTYEIGGPQVLTMIELHRAILDDHRPDARDRPLARPVRELAVALRLAAGRAADPRPVADARPGQRPVGQAARPRGVQDRADPARARSPRNGSAASARAASAPAGDFI